MAINIKTAQASEPEEVASGPHADAAEEILGEITETVVGMQEISTESGTPVVKDSQLHSIGEAVAEKPDRDKLTVGMNFKMQVADYTTVGFYIGQTRQYDPTAVNPDDLFYQQKNFVEGKINELIEENNPKK